MGEHHTPTRALLRTALWHTHQLDLEKKNGSLSIIHNPLSYPMSPDRGLDVASSTYRLLLRSFLTHLAVHAHTFQCPLPPPETRAISVGPAYLVLSLSQVWVWVW